MWREFHPQRSGVFNTQSVETYNCLKLKATITNFIFMFLSLLLSPIKSLKSRGTLHQQEEHKLILSGERRNFGVISRYNVGNKRSCVRCPLSSLHKTSLGSKRSCTADTMHPHDRTRIISLSRAKNLFATYGKREQTTSISLANLFTGQAYRGGTERENNFSCKQH